MDGEETAKMAERYPDVIVGIKTAHFNGRNGYRWSRR